MKKQNKELQSRIEGMIYAYNIVSKAENAEQGIKDLKKDIKLRGYTRAPMKFTKRDIDDYLNFTSKNLYATMAAVTLITLQDEFGFGKMRLQRFKERFDEKVSSAMDFDYLGEHYATMEDYAIYLNKHFDLGIDVERIAMCQETFDKDNQLKGKADINEVINLLKQNRFKKAAEFIERRISKS